MVLLLPMVSFMKLSAEEDLLWLPEYFERVQELSDVEDGAYYLIAGMSQKEGHVLMTTELVNKKFKGVVAPQQDRIFCEDATHVWQIHRSGNEVILRAVASGHYLYVPKSNKPEVELQSNSYTAWELQQKEDGFVLKNPSEQLRYLHTSRQSSADNPILRLRPRCRTPHVSLSRLQQITLKSVANRLTPQYKYVKTPLSVTNPVSSLKKNSICTQRRTEASTVAVPVTINAVFSFILYT
jgi:hypothetical protein